MLKITIEKETGRTKLKLEGKLAGPWVSEFERSWMEVETGCPGNSFTVDLTEVIFIDPEGQKLLGRMYCRGVRLQGSGVLIKNIIERIERAEIASNSTRQCH
ncbi:MAG: hypothetical protein ACRD2B_16805 [Terriglobia bacterium]